MEFCRICDVLLISLLKELIATHINLVKICSSNTIIQKSSSMISIKLIRLHEVAGEQG